MTAPNLPVYGDPAASVEHCLALAADKEAKAVERERAGHPSAPLVREMAEGWMRQAIAIAEYYRV